MPELTMLLYPWDAQGTDPRALVDEVTGLGVTRLQIATAYHSAEVISPRRSSGVMRVAEANRLHLPVTPGAFTDLAVPASTVAESDPDLYPALKEAADAAGLGFDGWAIAFHNTDLATQRPDAAIVNCFGDSFTHGLCPANPAARRFALELLGAVSGTGLFDRILVESLSYLLVAHGHPHELWGARLDPVTRYLLSLCFCASCVAEGQREGVDVVELRARVAAELTRTWNADHPAGRAPDSVAELSSFLVAWPGFAEYTRMRLDVVSSLLEEAVATVRGAGARLDASAAVWGRPAPTNWLEGVDIPRTLSTADGFVLESYFPTAGEVAAEIDHTRALAALVAEPAELSVALTVWPNLSPTRGDFLAKVEAVRGAGVERLALYNYGTATAASLAWVRAAAELMGTIR